MPGDCNIRRTLIIGLVCFLFFAGIAVISNV